jgi:chromosome segregation ATPase
MCGIVITNDELYEQSNGNGHQELDPAACLQEIDEITRLKAQLAHARAARDIYHKNAQAASRELGKLEQAHAELQKAHDQLAEENLALSRHNLEMAAKAEEKLKDYEKLQERHKRVHEQAAWLSEEREQLTQENGKLHQKIAELEDDLEASSEGYETMRQHVEQRLLSIQIGLRSLAGASVASWLAGGLAVLDVLIDQTKHDLSDEMTYRTRG